MHKCLIAMKKRSSEDGLSLVEVLVAMMIFAMLVVGIGYSLINILKMTRDSQSRETAVSLASSELDAARAIGDPFKILNVDRTITVDNTTYSISRKAVWVTPGGTAETCGSGGAALQYKTVSVSVSWNGLSDSAAVKADTAIVPTTRINNPDLGTILVSVKNASGLGNAGVSFTAKPATGDALVTTPTNADGCSFLLSVTPGMYTVKLLGSNNMDIDQVENPEVTLDVKAGASAQFGFQYDKRGTYVMSYASNDGTTPQLTLPNNLTTTFINTISRYTTIVPTAANLQGSKILYAASAGYEVVAGTFIPGTELGSTCASVNPAAWPDTTTPPIAVSPKSPKAFTLPGGTSATTPVPMGTLKVTGTSSKKYVYAISQAVALAEGQPGCDTAKKYTFSTTFAAGGSTMNIALPFGSWALYESTAQDSGGTPIAKSKIALITPGVVASDGIFVLDPRVVTP